MGLRNVVISIHYMSNSLTFEENRFRIDGENAENHAILVNLTASIMTFFIFFYLLCLQEKKSDVNMSQDKL